MAVCAKALEGQSHETVCKEGPSPKLDADCKAEVQKRIDICMKKPGTPQAEIDDCTSHRKLPDPAKEPDKFCPIVVWDEMLLQSHWRAPDPSLEVPKATMHDAKLEGMVKAAYDSDDHGVNKVLKVVLEGWADDFELDAFNHVIGRDMNATVVNKQPDGTCSLHSELYMQHGHGKSFSGPFESRGAGSAHDQDILCEKVEPPAKK